MPHRRRGTPPPQRGGVCARISDPQAKAACMREMDQRDKDRRDQVLDEQTRTAAARGRAPMRRRRRRRGR